MDYLTIGANNISYELFSKQQIAWLEKAEAFSKKISKQEKIASDKTNTFRRDLFEEACCVGFGSLPFAEEFGGSGGDYVSFCLVNEEFARRCVPIMSSLGVHVLCQEPIYKFGTREQKNKYLPPCSKGSYLAAFALTEPGAGSDTAALITSAKYENGNYILNGSKIFITSGSVADLFIVFARSEKGISAFIVEKGFPGLDIGQKFDLLGMRGYGTCEIVFSNCKVPANNILGESGMGRKVALSSLAKGRVTIAAQALGWARGAIDGLVQVTEAEAALKKKSNKHLLSDLLVNIEAASALTYQAARAIDNGNANVVLASMAKLKATDIAMRAADQALTFTRIAGLQEDFFIERIYRDAKAGQIYEGTNQIQKLLIAREIFTT